MDEQADFHKDGLDHRGEPKQGGLFRTQSLYTYQDFAEARTEDPLWNAAQMELRKTGKIHGYVRMYWGKQIIQWCSSWQEAYAIAVKLNDTYAIDGLSPNGYTGVAWCFGKHDRPFPPKKAHWGLVRSMKISGMKKRFNTDDYIRTWTT